MASTTKPTDLLLANSTSDSAVMPRPTTKLPLLPVWNMTTLTSDSPAIHQNHRAAERMAGLVNATSPAVGWPGTGAWGPAGSLIEPPPIFSGVIQDIGSDPLPPLRVCQSGRAPTHQQGLNGSAVRPKARRRFRYRAAGLEKSLLAVSAINLPWKRAPSSSIALGWRWPWLPAIVVAP